MSFSFLVQTALMHRRKKRLSTKRITRTRTLVDSLLARQRSSAPQPPTPNSTCIARIFNTGQFPFSQGLGSESGHASALCNVQCWDVQCWAESHSHKSPLNKTTIFGFNAERSMGARNVKSIPEKSHSKSIRHTSLWRFDQACEDLIKPVRIWSSLWGFYQACEDLIDDTTATLYYTSFWSVDFQEGVTEVGMAGQSASLSSSYPRCLTQGHRTGWTWYCRENHPYCSRPQMASRQAGLRSWYLKCRICYQYKWKDEKRKM